MTVPPLALIDLPPLAVRQWPRDRWRAEFEALAVPRALSWVSVHALGTEDLAAVLPWHPVVSLVYDPDTDRIEIATLDGVHRIARPLALFSLGDGAEVNRVVVVGFDGGLDLIDVIAGSHTPTSERACPKRHPAPAALPSILSRSRP